MAMRMRKTWVVFTLFSIAAVAENWPQWRGPRMDGTSTEKNLPVKWSASENIAWKLALPNRSGSTPIIWGDSIFLNVAHEGKVELWMVDRKAGTVSWKKHLSDGDQMVRKHNMSSPSPVTDGKHVWVLTGTGFLKCFDFAGAEKWTRAIEKEYGKFGLNHGYGSSPLLDGGFLYVQVLHGMKTDDPSYILKIDGATGKTIWRQERPNTAVMESPDSYTTPLLASVGGKKELIISGADVVTGHDPDTGKELWRGGGFNPGNNPFHRIIASPVISGDQCVYAHAREAVHRLQGGRQGRRNRNSPDVAVPEWTGRAEPGNRRNAPVSRDRPGSGILPGSQNRRGSLWRAKT